MQGDGSCYTDVALFQDLKRGDGQEKDEVDHAEVAVNKGT